MFAAFVALIPAISFAQSTDDDIRFDYLRGEVPKYNLQFFRPAPNPGDYLTTYGAMIDDEDWRVTGGFYLHYAHVPMSIQYVESKAKKSIVYNQTYLDLYASVSLFKYAEIAVTMPFALTQRTDFNDAVYPLSKLHKSGGVGDLRITAKGKILDLREYPLGLALIADLSAPTGNSGKLMGDGGVSFTILAATEFNPWSKLRFAVNLGYRYRPHRDVYDFDMGQALIISGGVAVPFFHKDLDFLVDMHGEITIDPKNKHLSSQERPFESDFAFRYRILDGDSWYRGLAITAGIGAGMDSVGSADVRAFLGLNFHWVNGGMLNYDFHTGGYLTAVDPCPDPEITPISQIPERCRNVTVDSDGDTIPDSKDKCPFSGRVGYINDEGCPEDRDGDTVPDYEDLCPDEGGKVDIHGCPKIDVDSDGDTLLDSVDQCPSQPETFNGYEDEDGCPDSDPNALVSLSDGKIDIKEQVFFETSKAIIKQESYDLLNQVAQLLIDNPHIGNITIEGHTDSRGKYKSNMKLSQDRADSVMKYLIKRGVDASRLNAIGYGPDRPIDTNDTADGRARNRRVEFVVLGLPDDAKTPNQ